MIFNLLSFLGLVPTFQKTKCKKLLSLTMERIKVLNSRREAQLRQLYKDLAKLRQLGEEQKVQVWRRCIQKERDLLSVYSKIAACCESVQVKLKDIAGQSACSKDLKEPVAGLCFAASCCADLPELQELREIFAMKYGKEFVTSVQELGQKCLIEEEAGEKDIIAKGELEQGIEQAVREQQEQERQVMMDAYEGDDQPPLQDDDIDVVTTIVEDGNDNELVQSTAAVRVSAVVPAVCEEDLATREMAREFANRKKAGSEGRKTRRFAFKRACKRRQSSVNAEGDDVGENMDVATAEACNADNTTAHEAPNKHIVLYVKQPTYSLPPQRPPPPPPPPKRAPPPPTPKRVASMPSARHNKDDTGYTSKPLPLRCSTMAKNQYDESYCGSHVHPRLPKYEELVANFTALKHPELSP